MPDHLTTAQIADELAALASPANAEHRAEGAAMATQLTRRMPDIAPDDLATFLLVLGDETAIMINGLRKRGHKPCLHLANLSATIGFGGEHAYRMAQVTTPVDVQDEPPVGKPPLPTSPIGPGDRFPRVAVDPDDPDVVELLRTAGLAADCWTTGPDGPYKHPRMTRAEECRNQITEGLMHLLELGLVDIDRERLAAMLHSGMPLTREATG